MSQKIYFHKYNGDNRVLDKWTYSAAAPNKTFDIYDLTSMLAPQIVIDYDTNVFGYNYCYVDLFERYFYITDIAVEAGRRMILTLGVDVLNTYKNAIKGADVTVVRSESIGHPTYIPDDQFPIYPTLSAIDIKRMENIEKPFIRNGEQLEWNYLIGTI